MAEIVIDRDIVFYDLETTSLNASEARIISIACIKLTTDGEEIPKSMFVNPGIPIPPEATAINGITDEAVRDVPTFRQIYKRLLEFMRGCVIVGFNQNHFDNVVLAEEFARCNVVFPTCDDPSIDVGQLYKLFYPRTLAECYKNYTGETLEDAHVALADATATKKCLFAMIGYHQELQNKTLIEIASMTPPKGHCDWAGKIAINNKGEYIYNFHDKKKGKRVIDDKAFAEWMLNKGNFTENTKMWVRHALRWVVDDGTNKISQLYKKKEAEFPISDGNNAETTTGIPKQHKVASETVKPVQNNAPPKSVQEQESAKITVPSPASTFLPQEDTSDKSNIRPQQKKLFPDI